MGFYEKKKIASIKYDIEILKEVLSTLYNSEIVREVRLEQVEKIAEHMQAMDNEIESMDGAEKIGNLLKEIQDIRSERNCMAKRLTDLMMTLDNDFGEYTNTKGVKI